MELQTTTVTRIESNTNIATFRLLNTHTQMQTKENTHIHTQQYRTKVPPPPHTHQNTLSKTYKKTNNNA